MVAGRGDNLPTQFFGSPNYGIDMDAPDLRYYAIANNNNNNNNIYMPGLPRSIPTLPVTSTFPVTARHHMPSSILTGQSINRNFTFTNPTQGSMITHAAPLYTAPMSAIPAMPLMHNIPGIGAQWQHTVPQNMPWAQALGASYITEFTAQAANQSTMPFPLPQVVSRPEPQASCSFIHRRPKRQFTNLEPEGVPVSKMHVTDDMMMARMRELHITTPPGGGKRSQPELQDNWQKFRDLEERLQEESADSVMQEDVRVRRKTLLPHLRLKAGIKAQDLLKPSHILPTTILNDLNKPCMEVVLWKPPAIVKNIENVPPTCPHSIDTTASGDSSISSHPRCDSNVTNTVPSISFGDSCLSEMTPNVYSVDNIVCDMDDDMDL